MKLYGEECDSSRNAACIGAVTGCDEAAARDVKPVNDPITSLNCDCPSRVVQENYQFSRSRTGIAR